MTDNTIAETSAHGAQILAEPTDVSSQVQSRADGSAHAAPPLRASTQRHLGAGLYTPAQIARWRKVTDAVHDKGGQMFVQLWYVGCHVPIADAEVRRSVVEDFRVAAAQAMAAGFDGIELHVNDGVLLEQYLKSGSSPQAGHVPPMDQRVRLLMSVITAVVTEVGDHRVGVLIAPASPDLRPGTVASSPNYSFISGRLGVAYLRVADGAMRGLREARPFDRRALLAYFKPSDPPVHPLRRPQEPLFDTEPPWVEATRVIATLRRKPKGQTPITSPERRTP